MIIEASRARAVDKLHNFVENNLSEYSKLRNFDFGPDNRSNISCLSPYMTNGIISELEVIDKSLKKFSFSKNEKFIQEVLWRVYWKGWLELRPNVWTDYLVELNNLRNEFKDKQNYLDAVEGKTDLEFFNQWVNELKENFAPLLLSSLSLKRCRTCPVSAATSSRPAGAEGPQHTTQPAKIFDCVLPNAYTYKKNQKESKKYNNSFLNWIEFRLPIISYFSLLFFFQQQKIY